MRIETVSIFPLDPRSRNSTIDGFASAREKRRGLRADTIAVKAYTLLETNPILSRRESPRLPNLPACETEIVQVARNATDTSVSQIHTETRIRRFAHAIGLFRFFQFRFEIFWYIQLYSLQRYNGSIAKCGRLSDVSPEFFCHYGTAFSLQFHLSRGSS